MKGKKADWTKPDRWKNIKIFEPNKDKLFSSFQNFFIFSKRQIFLFLSRPVALHSSNSFRVGCWFFSYFNEENTTRHFPTSSGPLLGCRDWNHFLFTSYIFLFLSYFFPFLFFNVSRGVCYLEWISHTHGRTAGSRPRVSLVVGDISRCFTFDWFHVRESHHARPSGSLSLSLSLTWASLFFRLSTWRLMTETNATSCPCTIHPPPLNTRRGEGNFFEKKKKKN